jgi:uncharacterized protein YcaQ
LRGLHWIRDIDFEQLDRGKDREEFVALLTLMDNLIRDRKWLSQLFGYVFEVEYFQKKGMRWHVNILYNDEFVGFIDPKIDRPKKLFIIKDIAMKRELDDIDWKKIVNRIVEFACFHDSEAIHVLRVDTPALSRVLQLHGFAEEKKGQLVLPVEDS